ncbi:MAG: hypothetical protein JOY61_15085, partial [Chloroflexi bacterium]|nr:hypothetical protein [Chloroflexota bacterium]
MSEHPASLLKSGQPTGALALIEVLPLMVGESRSGRLSAEENGGSQLHVWLEDGRVVHVTWGQLSGLSALELAAIFLPRSSFVFTEGLQPAARTFELSPVVLASRLAEVAREAAPFVPVIPGPQAKPSRVKKSPGVISPDMARLLARIDGQQTVSDLVDNRQPLTVLRPLARLVQAGAISFEPAAPAEPAETVTQHVEPAAAEVGPARHDPVESVPDQPAEVQSGAGAESQKAAGAESDREGLPAVPLAAGASHPAEAPTPRRGRLSATAIPAVALTALVLIIGAIVLGVRASTSEAPEPLALQATAAPTEVPTVAPTQVPTAAPTQVPTAAPTQVPTAAPTEVPTVAPTEAPTAAPTEAPTAAPTQVPTAAPTEVPTVA